MNAPEFKSFTFPLIRKPAKQLVGSDLIMTPEERADLFLGVLKHASEVFESLKDCKCPKCVPVDES